jgi:RNA 2',3'-cyclic 3'-phosphodiesterase
VDSYRTFIAIELPGAVRAKLIEHIQQLRREVPDVRASWSREHNLHLTLKFLGNVPVGEIPKLSDAVARAVVGIEPFELTVAGCGAFPPKGRPNVLWIGVGSAPGSAGILPAGRGHLARTSATQASGPGTHASRVSSSAQDTQASGLLDLHSAIEHELAAVGFPREQRTFHPHLTIARLRKTGDERRVAEAHQKRGFPVETFRISEVVVFKSELLREGSKHTAISRHALRA